MNAIRIDKDLHPEEFAAELSRSYKDKMQSLVDQVYDAAFFESIESRRR